MKPRYPVILRQGDVALLQSGSVSGRQCIGTVHNVTGDLYGAARYTVSP
jgi:hypothetical protein